MKKMRILPVLPVIVLILFIHGCSEDRYSDVKTFPNGLSVKISFTGTQEPIISSVTPLISNLKLYFIIDGKISEIKDISGSDVNNGFVEKTFADLSAFPDSVIAIGNTHIFTLSGLADIVIGSSSDDLGRLLLDHHAQAGSESPVIFYGDPDYEAYAHKIIVFS